MKRIIMRIEAAISAALAGFPVWPLWAFLTIQQGERHGGLFLMLLVLLLWPGSAAFAPAAFKKLPGVDWAMRCGRSPSLGLLYSQITAFMNP